MQDLMRQRVEENKKHFDKLCENINSLFLSRKIKKIQRALKFATLESTGNFSSSLLESQLLQIASKIKVKERPFRKNSILHVLSQGYDTGGHTRVVERWIQHSMFKNDVVILRPNKAKLNLLKNLVNVIEICEKNELKLAKKLKTLALSYDKIILHTHMDEVAHILAFGNDFNRSVFLFNHADHMFWSGVSVSDMVINFRNVFAKNINDNFRGIKVKQITLPLISDVRAHNKISKQQARKNLQIPQNAEVLLSIGSAYKYKSFDGVDFLEIIQKTLDIRKEAYFIIIGIDFNILSEWQNFKHPRCRIYPVVSSDKLSDFYGASDLYVDSAPIGGGCALVDALMNDLGILSLESVLGQSDFIFNSPANCTDINELLEKINLYFDDKYFFLNLRKNTFSSYQQFNSYDTFKSALRTIENTQISHQIYQFEDVFINNITTQFLAFFFHKMKIVKRKFLFLEMEKKSSNFGRKFKVRLIK